MRMLADFGMFAILIALSSPTMAQVSRSSDVKSSRAIVYHGKIVRPNGVVMNGSFPVTLKILSPDPKLCVLWTETQNVEVKDGAFAIELGHAVNRSPGAGGGAAADFSQAFINNPSLTISSASCAAGNSYTPASSDDRLLSASFSDGGNIIEIEGMPIKSVPYALQAEEIGGYGLANLAKISGAGSAVSYSPAEAQTLKDMLGGDVLFDMKSRRVTNVATPTATTDAVTKGYVDTAIAGVSGGGGGSGTVTSIGVSVPSYMSSTGGAVTTSGTIALDFQSQTANRVFAAPDGAAGVPSFRGLVAADIPALDAAKLTTGVLSAARGGTGVAPTAGDAGKFYGVNAAGSSAEFKTISAGANVVITPTAGGIEIASTGAGGGGSVTSVGVSGLPLSVANPSTTPQISIAQANSTTAGYLSAADWNTFNGKQAAGSYLTSISNGNVTTALGFTPVSNALATGQVYLGVGGVATASNFGIGQMRNNVGTLQMPTSCTSSQTLTWSAVTDVLVCSNIDGLNADKLTAGTLATARLGSGTADTTKYLRGDGSWQTLPAGADNLGDHTATQNLNLGAYQLVGNGGSSGIAIGSTGNVGVGTASPITRLHVGKISGVATSSVGDHVNGATDNQSGINQTAYSDGNNYIDYKTFTGGFTYFRTGQGTESGAQRIWMSVLAGNGNVGIGSASPASKLQVAGTITVPSGDAKAIQGTSASSWLVLGSDAGSNGLVNGTGSHIVLRGSAHTQAIEFYQNTARTNTFHASGGVSLGPGYAGADPGANNVITTGKVGIGTSSPAAKLDVNGAIKLGSMTACTSTEEGSQRYNSTLKIMEFCDGTAWQSFGGSASIPTGAVMAFDLASCPSGWTALTAANGRVIVGVGSNGTNTYALNASGGADSITLSAAQMPAHTHSIDPPSATTASSGAHTHTYAGQGSTIGGGGPTNNGTANGATTASAGAHTHTVDIPSFTSGSAGSGSAVDNRQAYYALLYCKKN